MRLEFSMKNSFESRSLQKQTAANEITQNRSLNNSTAKHRLFFSTVLQLYSAVVCVFWRCIGMPCFQPDTGNFFANVLRIPIDKILLTIVRKWHELGKCIDIVLKNINQN